MICSDLPSQRQAHILSKLSYSTLSGFAFFPLLSNTVVSTLILLIFDHIPDYFPRIGSYNYTKCFKASQRQKKKSVYIYTLYIYIYISPKRTLTLSQHGKYTILYKAASLDYGLKNHLCLFGL